MVTKIEVSPNSNWLFKELVVGVCDVWRLGGETPIVLYHPGNFRLSLQRNSVAGIRFKVDEGLGTNLRVYGNDLSVVNSDVEPEQLPRATISPDYFYSQYRLYKLVGQGAALWYQEKDHPDYLRVVNLEPDR